MAREGQGMLRRIKTALRTVGWRERGRADPRATAGSREAEGETDAGGPHDESRHAGHRGWLQGSAVSRELKATLGSVAELAGAWKQDATGLFQGRPGQGKQDSAGAARGSASASRVNRLEHRCAAWERTVREREQVIGDLEQQVRSGAGRAAAMDSELQRHRAERQALELGCRELEERVRAATGGAEAEDGERVLELEDALARQSAIAESLRESSAGLRTRIAELEAKVQRVGLEQGERAARKLDHAAKREAALARELEQQHNEHRSQVKELLAQHAQQLEEREAKWTRRLAAATSTEASRVDGPEAGPATQARGDRTLADWQTRSREAEAEASRAIIELEAAQETIEALQGNLAQAEAALERCRRVEAVLGWEIVQEGDCEPGGEAPGGGAA